jgi:hypothetical protein
MSALQAWLTDVAALWALTRLPIFVWGNRSAARLHGLFASQMFCHHL